MQNAEDTKTFEEEMKAILAGEKEAPNKTIGHFAERFNKARAEQETLTQDLQKLEQQMSEGRVNLAKLSGYIEGLAVDLRQLWNDANGPSTQPEIIEAA